MDCTPSSLLSLAKCFDCLTVNQLEAVETYLLCQIVSSGGTGGGGSGGASVPSGSILMWSGTIATIPTGFQICDGTNGTPDLRDKFVVGARQDSAGLAKTNIGGSLVQTGGHVVQATGTTFAVTAGTGGTSAWSSAHTGLPLSGGFPVTDYLPPFFALAYIMKL